MALRTLHSDHTIPHQVLAVYVCPQCGHERRIPIERPDGADPGERSGRRTLAITPGPPTAAPGGGGRRQAGGGRAAGAGGR
jgi:hypothetical protein